MVVTNEGNAPDLLITDGPLQETVSVPLSSTSTPTPFHPLELTPGISDLDFPQDTSWGNYPGPSVQPAVPIPPPAELFKLPAGQVNIIIFGSDQRPGDIGLRTDTILLVSLNPIEGTATITSFPRDLYVYIPGWTVRRINTAHQHGGFDLTVATFEYNFGFQPDHFVLVSLQGFVDAIDNLGGISVDVEKALTDKRAGYGNYTVNTGTNHMDGETTLWYVRSRYSSNDFDRNRRQQEVIIAIFKKLISVNAIFRIPELYGIFRDDVETDMVLKDMTPMVGLISRIGNDPSRISRYAIGPAEVMNYRVPSSGAQVLLPKHAEIRNIMQNALQARE